MPAPPECAMIIVRSILTIFSLLICSFFLVVFIANAQPGSQGPENIRTMWYEWKNTAEKGVKDPLTGWHYYWKDGFYIDSTKRNLKFRFNGRVLLDGGSIGADNGLNRAFHGMKTVEKLFSTWAFPIPTNFAV